MENKKVSSKNQTNKNFKAKMRCRKCGYVIFSWDSLGYDKEVTIWDECTECNTNHDWRKESK